MDAMHIYNFDITIIKWSYIFVIHAACTALHALSLENLPYTRFLSEKQQEKFICTICCTFIIIKFIQNYKSTSIIDGQFIFATENNIHMYSVVLKILIGILLLHNSYFMYLHVMCSLW